MTQLYTAAVPTNDHMTAAIQLRAIIVQQFIVHSFRLQTNINHSSLLANTNKKYNLLQLYKYFVDKSRPIPTSLATLSITNAEK